MVQKLANAFVKTLKFIDTHSAAEIADKMPKDYLCRRQGRLRQGARRRQGHVHRRTA